MGRLTWIRRSSCKSSATHSYQCVQYFHVSKHSYGCQCLGFLTSAQMLMRAITLGGCTDTVRESALEVDSGRQIPSRTGNSNPRQYYTWRFHSDALPTELSRSKNVWCVSLKKIKIVTTFTPSIKRQSWVIINSVRNMSTRHLTTLRPIR